VDVAQHPRPNAGDDHAGPWLSEARIPGKRLL
jgi:hypothetical protein